jgi:hypothetical protein
MAYAQMLGVARIEQRVEEIAVEIAHRAGGVVACEVGDVMVDVEALPALHEF